MKLVKILSLVVVLCCFVPLTGCQKGTKEAGKPAEFKAKPKDAKEPDLRTEGGSVQQIPVN